jgi:hypothetical protein
LPTNPVFTDPNNALLKDRLARISEQLRNLVLSTADEYQAEVYSAVNAVLDLGVAMTPLFPVAAAGPATVGDVINNYTVLNNDAADIASEMLRIENSTADFFNLAATSQNQLRQQIREFIFASNPNKYNEEFLNVNNLTSITANLDFNAGVATNALIDETSLSPIFTIGQRSIGSIDASSSIGNLSDGRVDTALLWNGSSIELVLTFPTPQIMNRISIDLDDYNGLEIDTFTTSPDGTLIEDVLLDIDMDRIILDGTSNKFSGDVIIDFPPRHVKTARLIIQDRVGAGLIAFRGFACSARRYSSTGQLTSLQIASPTGTVLFDATQNVFAPYVSITHQISYNGTQFTAINPGDSITLIATPYYYRAVLERSTSRFNTSSNALAQTPLDPIASPNYTLASTTTTPLGNGIIERTLQVNSVVGPIVLRDIPMPNTLSIQEGSVILSQANGDYTFTNNTISFMSSVTGLTISYQTSSLGASALKDREEYYTPLLYSISFTQE